MADRFDAAALDQLDEAELFRLWAAVMRALRVKGVIRTDKSPTGDYAEWLVARHYGVELEGSAAEAGFDLTRPDGHGGHVRVQVKARKRTATSNPGHYGDFGELGREGFDEFVGIVFDEDFHVLEARVAPFACIRELAKPVKGKHRVTLKALRDDPRAIKLDLDDAVPGREEFREALTAIDPEPKAPDDR